ncbi:MAG: TetR/AcrR family transcriptional regulator [Pseudomonadales bacterium]
MARRNDHSRDELRAMVLKAGRDIVTEEGIQKLTTRAIAKRIGYSVGTIYVLFKDVDELKFALNAGTLAEFRSRLSDALAPVTDPEQRLHSMAQFYLEFGLANTSLWRLMFEHQLPGDDPMPEEITKETDKLLLIAGDALREIVPALEENELNHLAAAIWASLHGIAHLVITNKLSLANVDSGQAVLDTQMRVFIAGLEKLH